MASRSPQKLAGIKDHESNPEPYRKVVQEPFKAKNCFFYRDGDTKFKAVKICIHPRRYQRMEALISELSTKVKLPFGVRSIFTPRGRDMITSIDKLENGESYVCSQMRHQARGVDPNKVLPPPRWYYDKPSSGTKELNHLLQEFEFEDRARYVGRHYMSRDQRMAYAYNRAQPKKITVLKNGEPQVRHVVLINRRTAQRFEQILSDISGMFQMAVRKLFTLEGKRISNLSSLINGPDVLVAAGKESFKTMVGFVYEPMEKDPHSRVRSRLEGSRLEHRPTDMGTDRIASRMKKRRDRLTKTRGSWKVWCTTNELSTAGTTAQVSLTVYGHKGNSGPITLGFPDSVTFQPGQVDEFDVNFGSQLGEVYKIRISHDNSGDSPGWFCDEIRMQDEDTDEQLVFPCRRWLARNEDDHEICREIPAIRKGEPHLPVIKYEVSIVTGDLWNGGTQANVYLTIYGDRGDTGVRQLYVSDKEQAFNKGQTNHFSVEAVSLGHLKRVIVGHDGTAAGEGWFLEKLSIQEPEAKPHEIYHFYCGRWLDEGEDDGKIVRELKVQDEYMEDILEKRNWEFEKWKFENKSQVMFMSMLTGKALRVKADGTLDGLGEDTDAGSIFMVSSKKPMIRIFTSLLNKNFHLAMDHGKPTGQGRGGPQCEFRIHVQSDRTIMLEGAKSPLQFVTLQENGKLGDSRSTLDKDPAKRFHVYVKGALRHRGVIMLRTSNTQAISVDHDKSVYATGRCNRAAHFRVHKVEEGGIRMFESMIYPGFYLRLKDGKFDCNGTIDPEEDEGSRSEDSHFLVQKQKDKGFFTLQVNNQRGMYIGFTPRGGVRPTIDSGTNNVHVFPEVIEYGTSKQQALNDKLTPISERTGYNESPDTRHRTKPDFEDGDYRVLVSTAENLDQGQVALVAIGDKGSTGPIILSGPQDNGPLFKAGSTDEFKINLAKIGKPLKVRLELNPKNQSRDPSWKVLKMVMVDMKTQEKFVFDFDRWLARDKDDEDLMRELPVVKEGKEEEGLPVVKYFVTVYTGKDPAADTDAQIYINMYGDFGDSGKRQLRRSNRNRPFRQGQSDTFEIEAVHLGNLRKIQIGHNETRPKSGWYCDKVVIREGKTANMEFVFPCGRWFDSSMEDRKLERTLLVQAASKQNTKLAPAPSKVSPVRELSRELSSHPVLPPIGTPISQKSDNTEEFEKEEKRIMEEEVTADETEKVVPEEAATSAVEETEDEVDKTANENVEETVDETETEENDDEGEETVEEVEITEGENETIEAVDVYELEEEDDEEEEEEKDNEEIEDAQREEEVKDMLLEDEEAPTVKKENKASLQLWVTTHTDSVVPMQDTVMLYVYGSDGSAGPFVVGSGRDGLFKPGTTDELKLSVDQNVGKPYKIRIGLAEEQPGYEWHLEKLKVRESNSGQDLEFEVGRWMSRKKEDYDVWRELPVARLEEPPLPVILYTVEVHTSDISGANTSAAVFINLIGERGDSGKRKLHVTQTDGKIFSQGKIDRFVVEAVSLGTIKSVMIGHSEHRPGEGWHLASVAVKEYNMNDEEIETYFPCDKWLDAGQDDMRTERELFPGQRPKEKAKSNGEYRMWVTTSEDSPTAAGGKAVLTIYGDRGCSNNIDLFAPSSTAKLFEPGSSDEFEVSTGDIGDIFKLRISREDKPEWKAWHLEEIKLEDKATDEKFVFAFDRWMSRDMEDGDLTRELPVVTAGRELLAVKYYEVNVSTGDHWAAETDANVYITIYGTNGDSGRRLLHRSKSGKKKFQRAGNDVFTIEAVDLKTLESVMIGHDGRGPGAGWFLEHIIITEKGGAKQETHVFPCGKWLDEGEDDGKTERKLRIMDLPKISESHSVPSECGGQWKVTVRTSDLPGADTRAQVYLTIHGTRDYSHPCPLGDGSTSMDLFSPGKESAFDVTIGDIGELTKIRLEHDNRNHDPSWHVDWVQMKHIPTGFDCLFTFDRWLSEDKEDGQVFRECAMESPGWMPAPLLHYIIMIQTGRKPNSGAHGGICSINLQGAQGDTGQQLLPRPLITQADSMKDGILDVYMLEAVCVGEIRRVRLGFEGRGRAKQWFVESVKVMESLSAITENIYAANTWLDDEDNSAVVLPLTETGVASSLPRGVDKALLSHSISETSGSWDIWVWTGKQDSAGTRDVISLVLYGTSGPSSPVYMNKDKEFHAGSVVHSKIESGKIGDLLKIRFSFAERIGNASWFLERVKLKNCDSKQEFNFDYYNWVHSTEENLDGMVELPAIRPDIAPLSENNYKVVVTTGDLPCAETSAEVMLTMIGQLGDSGQRYLTKPRNNREPFRRGQTDEFELKMLDLGKISKILIGHSDYGRGHGWFCQQVSIIATVSTGSKDDKIETVFACNRWLDTGVDDRQITSEFSALGSVAMKEVVSPTARAASNGVWTCHIKAASMDKLDVSHVSPHASDQVSLVVYGTKGVKGPLELGDGGDSKLAPGRTETFKSLRFGDLGDLVKLRVSCGIEGDKEAMWIIEEVVLEDEMTREKLKFDYSHHVGEIGGDVRKEMPVIRPGAPVPALIKYSLRVDTEDVEDAGTTAMVYATLYGTKGDSGRRLLITEQGLVPFKQGNRSQFQIEAVDLGELEKIVITKGPGDPWLLNQIMVKAGQFGPVENIFIWSNWVGSADKRDEEVEVTLPVISGRPSTVAVPITKFPDFPVTRGQWAVETQTGPTGTSGDVTDVVAVFSGSKGESLPVSMKANRDRPFQSGMTDNLELSLAEDVGELIKIRLGFEDNSQKKSWHLQKIKFEDVDTKDTFWFALNDHVEVTDTSDGWKEFPVIWPGVFILPVIRYTILVETADLLEASTTAQVYVKLDGQMGSTGFRMLKDTVSGQPKFQQGQTDKFVIEAVSLMSVDSVTIGHNDKTTGAGWFLSKVTIRPNNEEEDYVFTCNRWLDAGQDDGETMRTLYLSGDSSTIVTGTQPSARPPDTPVEQQTAVEAAAVVSAQEKKAKSPSPEPEKNFAYEVTTVTGRGSGHGTSSTVVLVLYGEKGCSEPLVIGEDGLKEGETQTFKVGTEDVGELYKIRVGFDATGKEQQWYTDVYSCPSWFAEMIRIQEAKTGKVYEIEAKKWVRMEEDHDFWRELPVRKENPSQTLTVRDYYVDVYTGQKYGAGTRANVYLQLCGEHGDTGWRHLHGSRTNADKFVSGSHDLFRLEAVDLGKLSKVKVKHDGLGPGSGWYLDKVKVRESEEAFLVFLFECDRWLDQGEDDGAVERELPLTSILTEEEDLKSARTEDNADVVTAAPPVPEPEPEEDKPKAGDWRVYTVTSAEPGSSTDANVTLTVFGSKGDSGPLPLGSKGQGCFESGQTDQFDIWLEPNDIGEIRKVRLQHDNSGMSAGWRVEKLILENLYTGDKHTFNIDRWLSYEPKDGDIVHEMPFESGSQPALQACTYMVKTVTETDEDAGTEANVYINIYGSQGDCGTRFLKHNTDSNKKFASGKTNYFLLDAVDLGDLEKIVIGHDGTSPESSWKLLCVMIRKAESTTKETNVFPYGKWLSEEGGTETTIPVSDETVIDDDETPQEAAAEGPPAQEELALNLPETARTDNQETFRTDEGYQEDDGTYRTDNSVAWNNLEDIQSETDADQTAGMYTATDSSEEQSHRVPTDRETGLSNGRIALDIETARTDNPGMDTVEENNENPVDGEEVGDSQDQDGSVMARPNMEDGGEEEPSTDKQDVDESVKEDENENNDNSAKENEQNNENNNSEDVKADETENDAIDAIAMENKEEDDTNIPEHSLDERLEDKDLNSNGVIEEEPNVNENEEKAEEMNEDVAENPEDQQEETPESTPKEDDEQYAINDDNKEENENEKNEGVNDDVTNDPEDEKKDKTEPSTARDEEVNENDKDENEEMGAADTNNAENDQVNEDNEKKEEEGDDDDVTGEPSDPSVSKNDNDNDDKGDTNEEKDNEESKADTARTDNKEEESGKPPEDEKW